MIFSRVLRDSTPRFVGPSVRRSVGPSVRRSVRPSVTLYFLVACTRLYNPLCRSVRPSVRPSVRRSVRPSVRPSHFTFLFFCGLWPHCSCPSDQVTSNTAPAHPHATGVVVYPALLSLQAGVWAHNMTCSGNLGSFDLKKGPGWAKKLVKTSKINVFL